MRTLLLLWISFVSHSVYAANSLAVLTPQELLEASQQADFYLCEDEPKIWCHDDWRYYRVSFFAQVKSEFHSVDLQLVAPFSPHDYSQVQLNLRNDGFKLLRVEQDGEVFNVEEKISTAKSDAQFVQVDKALVVFLNKSLRASKVEQFWRNETWLVRLIKENDMIELHVSEREIK
ncbi:hypothetical protein [Vibrio sp. LaRot3]|uniref:hypothetical protein n=1 Tax=Vibrio sp. LaRot3 TaxID=2998829 RepID=UPI0022CDF818|nr:hypothetical protein [Vibrio sp. LaRot3]MDA0149099.1 hypothetical protein [Vibrio sp. LaRot3]